MRLRVLALMILALPGLAGAQPVSPRDQSAASAAMPGTRKFLKPTALSSKGVQAESGRYVGLVATLTSREGKAVPLAGKVVSFKVAGKDAGTATTGSTGEAMVGYMVPSDLPPGPLPLEARFAGDGEWGPSSVLANLTVMPPAKPAFLTWEGVTGKVGQTVTLTGKLTEGPYLIGKGIPGIDVSFSMDRGTRWALPQYGRISLCQGTTNALGIASCTVKLPPLALGFTGHAYAHVGAAWTVKYVSDTVIEIQKSPVQLRLSGPSAAHIGQSVGIKVHLTRMSDGSPLKGAAVFLILPRTTDDNGEVTAWFQLPSGPPGHRRYKATYAGNDSCEPAEAFFTISAQPAVN